MYCAYVILSFNTYKYDIHVLCVSFQHLCIDVLYVLFELSCEGEYIVKYMDNKSLDNIK